LEDVRALVEGRVKEMTVGGELEDFFRADSE
jgi:hypothetical protein